MSHEPIDASDARRSARRHPDHPGPLVTLANVVFVGVPAAYVASGSFAVTVLVTVAIAVLAVVYFVIERTHLR
jgi:hypothetical protein